MSSIKRSRCVKHQAGHHTISALRSCDNFLYGVELGEDRNDFGTEFGPTNVALHAVAVAVELGDAGHALDLAHGIDPERLSAERQARYSIDLALAHSMRRQIGESLRCLQLAEELTPEQTRTHRVARAVARDLLQLSGPRVRPELRELAERFGVSA